MDLDTKALTTKMNLFFNLVHIFASVTIKIFKQLDNSLIY